MDAVPGRRVKRQHEDDPEVDNVLLRLESDVFGANLLVHCSDVEGGFVFGGGLAVEGTSILDTQKVEHAAARHAPDQTLQQPDGDEEDAADNRPPWYFNTHIRARHAASDLAGRYHAGTACMCGPDLVCVAGLDLCYFENANLTVEPVRIATFARPALQLSSSADGRRFFARSFAEVCVFTRSANGFTQAARVHPQLLARSAEHAHGGQCHVMDASFGLRRDELLWTLSCGVSLCTSTRSEATLVVYKQPDMPLLACRNIGHSRRFLLLSPSSE